VLSPSQQLSIRKDGSLHNESKGLDGYLANSLIIVDPRQAHLQNGGTNSLAGRSVDHIFSESGEVAQRILQTEPIIGTIQFVSHNKTPVANMSRYLQTISHQEFPQFYYEISGDTSRDIYNHNPRPIVTYATPSGLLAKLGSVSRRQEQIKDKPFSYILDDPFLQELQQDISAITDTMGPIRDLPAFGEEESRLKIEDTSYAVHFKIGRQNVYIVGGLRIGGDSTTNISKVISIYSSLNKATKYSPLLGEGHLFYDLQTSSPKKIEDIINLLYSLGHLSIRQEYGMRKLQEIEDKAIRNKGKQLLDSGEQTEKAQRLIQLKLGRMEKYSLLLELAEENELEGMDISTWENLQDIIRGRKSFANLPPDQLIHFIQPSTEEPVIKELISQLRESVLKK